MTRLLNEVHAMQNPALGATLVWRFVCGYAPQNAVSDGAPLPLAFVVLPMVLHEQTRAHVTSTQLSSGARKFEEKFVDEGDVLYALNGRALAFRDLSRRSVSHGLASGLVTLIPETATLSPQTYTKPRGVAKSINELMSAAEKLGAWCRALSLYEVSRILRVEF